MILRPVLKAGIILLIFGLIGTIVVASIQGSTNKKWESNQYNELLSNLNSVLPSERYDNDIINNKITLEGVGGSKLPTDIYRATQQDKPAGIIFATSTPNGYSGTITLLVGVTVDGKLSGARILGHKETPGLGDAIHQDRSDWIYWFEGKSITNPSIEKWEVKRDGGNIDQITSATISSRAVVTAIKQVLIYYRDNSDTLFAQDQ